MRSPSVVKMSYSELEGKVGNEEVGEEAGGGPSGQGKERGEGARSRTLKRLKSDALREGGQDAGPEAAGNADVSKSCCA